MQCETICSTGEEDWCCITQPFSLHEKNIHCALCSVINGRMVRWDNWFGFQADGHGTQYNQTHFEVFMIFMLESVPIENIQNRMNSRWLLFLTNKIPGWAYIIIGLIPNGTYEYRHRSHTFHISEENKCVHWHYCKQSSSINIAVAGFMVLGSWLIGTVFIARLSVTGRRTVGSASPTPLCDCLNSGGRQQIGALTAVRSYTFAAAACRTQTLIKSPPTLPSAYSTLPTPFFRAMLSEVHKLISCPLAFRLLFSSAEIRRWEKGKGTRPRVMSVWAGQQRSCAVLWRARQGLDWTAL